jgi:MraZ protein
VTYLLGTYEYAMDARGRVPVPPRYRQIFAEGAIISQGNPYSCLRLFSAAAFERQAALYTSQPGTRKAGRIVRQGFFARSYPVELDGQGRILIPAPLREFAQLESNVLVVGTGEWLEIWAPERFQTQMAAVDDVLEETLELIEQPEERP